MKWERVHRNKVTDQGYQWYKRHWMSLTFSTLLVVLKKKSWNSGKLRDKIATQKCRIYSNYKNTSIPKPTCILTLIPRTRVRIELVSSCVRFFFRYCTGRFVQWFFKLLIFYPHIYIYIELYQRFSSVIKTEVKLKCDS